MNKGFEKLFDEFPAVTAEQWKEKIIKDLKGKDYSTLINKTEFGIDFEPFYTEEILDSITAVNNYPGKLPFIRGVKENNSWIITQYIFVNNFEDANKYALRLTESGVEQIVFVLKNINISTFDELKTLLTGIDLNKTQVSFKKQMNLDLLFDLFLKYIEENNFDKNKIQGSFNYAPFACYTVLGKMPNDEDEKLDKLYSLLNKLNAELPNYSLLTISGCIYYNAGANTVQEIAYTLNQAVEYFDIITEKDKTILPKLLSHTEVTMAIGSDYFVEIAKFRTIRWLWAQIVKQYGINDENIQKIKLNANTAFRNKTVYDPYVNMLRVTTETMSAAIAGVKSISVLPFDVAYKMPDDFSYRIAKNVQIILKEESYFDKIVDPAGGSYYIEKLTKEIADKSWQLFLSIEENGGYLHNIKNNTIQTQITEIAEKRKQKINTGKHSILGTNKYPNQQETIKDNIKKPIFSQVNEYDKFTLLHQYRDSEEFEKLRLDVENSAKTPKVFLFTYGNLAMRKARAMFSQNFFATAGFEIIDNAGFSTIDEGIQAVKQQNPDIVVACSSDDEYAEFVPELKSKLDSNIQLVVAGYPEKLVPEFEKIGVDKYIHVKSNILETLTQFYNEISKKDKA